MRTAIDWSYNLLNKQEQALSDGWACLCGGCTLEAVRGRMHGLGSRSAGERRCNTANKRSDHGQSGKMIDHSLLQQVEG